jgi:hypothetical protein
MDMQQERLRAHRKNIDRYEGLLRTQLTETERLFLAKRLCEERFYLSILAFAGPDPTVPNGYDF